MFYTFKSKIIIYMKHNTGCPFFYMYAPDSQAKRTRQRAEYYNLLAFPRCTPSAQSKWT